MIPQCPHKNYIILRESSDDKEAEPEDHIDLWSPFDQFWNEIFNLIRSPCRNLISSLFKVRCKQLILSIWDIILKSRAHQNVKQWMKINKNPNFACQQQSANEPNILTIKKIKTKNGIILSVHWMRPVLNFLQFDCNQASAMCGGILIQGPRTSSFLGRT